MAGVGTTPEYVDANPTAEQTFSEIVAAIPLDQKIVFGIIAGILFIIGIILTFRGKKCFRHLISIIVFIAAGLLPLFVVGLHKKIKDPESLRNQNWLILGPVCFATGIISACIVFFFYKFTLFITGSIGGFIFGGLLFKVFELHIGEFQFIDQEWWASYGQYFNIGIGILFALIFGILTLKLIDSALKILTPFIGSFMVTASICYFIEEFLHIPIFISLRTFYSDIRQGDDMILVSLETLLSLGGWFLLFLIGTIVQCRSGEEVDDETAHLYYYGDRKETAMYRNTRV